MKYGILVLLASTAMAAESSPKSSMPTGPKGEDDEVPCEVSSNVTPPPTEAVAEGGQVKKKKASSAEGTKGNDP